MRIHMQMRKVVGLRFKFDYLLICILGLHCFLWFKDDLLYIGGDSGMPLNPIKNLKHLFMWKEQLGGVESWNITTFFNYFVFAVFKFIKLDLVSSQRLYIYIMHTLSGITMYYLVSGFSNAGRITRLIASLFYMFNPFMLGMVMIPVFIPYHLSPLTIGFYIRGVLDKNRMILYVLLSAISFLPMIGDLPSYKHICVPLIIIFLFTIFDIIFRKSEKAYTIKIFFTFTFIFIMFMLWFILPYFSLLSYTTISELVSSHGISFPDYGYATIPNLLRLLGSGSFRAGGLPCGQAYFNNPFLILCGYVIAFLVFSAIFLKAGSKETRFFTILAVIFIFFAKGTNPPFGNVYKFIVSNFPAMRVFRTSFSMSFGAAIAYSFLLGISTEAIYSKLKRGLRFKLPSSIIFVIFIVSLILVNGWPFLTGDNLQNYYNPVSYQGVEIPSSYFEVEEHITSLDTDSRFLKIPASSSGYIYTDWHYGGSNLIPFIFSNPFIDGYYLNNAGRSISMVIYKLIEEGKIKNLHKLLGLLNVRYIIIDGHDNLTREKLDTYIDIFLKKQSIVLEKVFGQIYVFKNNYFILHIYTKNNKLLSDDEE